MPGPLKKRILTRHQIFSNCLVSLLSISFLKMIIELEGSFHQEKWSEKSTNTMKAVTCQLLQLNKGTKNIIAFMLIILYAFDFLLLIQRCNWESSGSTKWKCETGLIAMAMASSLNFWVMFVCICKVLPVLVRTVNALFPSVPKTVLPILSIAKVLSQFNVGAIEKMILSRHKMFSNSVISLFPISFLTMILNLKGSSYILPTPSKSHEVKSQQRQWQLLLVNSKSITRAQKMKKI